MRATPLTIRLAGDAERHAIYALRHDVYACELHQHPTNERGRLTDALDDVNEYLVALRGGEVLGFVAITPPGAGAYAVDKYFARADMPLDFDDGLYEVRLLTVASAHRHTPTASSLLYGALRHVESRGGRTVVAIGRVELLDMYRRVGMRPLGLQTVSGEVRYELMTAAVCDLRARLSAFARTLRRLERAQPSTEHAAHEGVAACPHGGAFFDVIGDEFQTLERRHLTINADVLDAWFDPAPAVVQALSDHLAFAIRTSPPIEADGMRRAIARARGIPEASILPGAGSSSLIFAGDAPLDRPGLAGPDPRPDVRRIRARARARDRSRRRAIDAR